MTMIISLLAIPIVIFLIAVGQFSGAATVLLLTAILNKLTHIEDVLKGQGHLPAGKLGQGASAGAGKPLVSKDG